MRRAVTNPLGRAEIFTRTDAFKDAQAQLEQHAAIACRVTPTAQRSRLARHVETAPDQIAIAAREK